MADWLFNQEHALFRDTVRRYIEREIEPKVKVWEESGEVPRKIFRQVGEQGYLGIRFPSQWGGLDGDCLFEAVWIEELARVGAGGVGAALSGHTTIGLTPIWRWGTEEQKRRYLAPGIRGEKIAALAITEPDGGSDVAGMTTVAQRTPAGFRLYGSKLFITNGGHADVVVVAAKTEPSQGHRGISLFLVERQWPGFQVGRILDKLGWRSSDTAELFFDGVLVPHDNVLGEINQGFKYLMENFQWERIAMSLAAVALADRALVDAISYAHHRRQFGRPLAGFQVIRHRLVDLAADIEKSRQLTYRALFCYSGGEDASTLATMAKAYAGEMVRRVADGALQVFGGNGYMMDYPIQRYWRDARVVSIGGGTTEIMHEILTKKLGLKEEK